MSFLHIYVSAYAVILLCLTALWLVSVVIKNVSIIDIFWGTGFVIATLVYFGLTEGNLPRKVLVMILVVVWGLRLSLHLARRNLGKGEDYRYQSFRRHYGESYWWKSFFQTFLLQGTLMWIISLPLLAAQFSSESIQITIWDVLGCIVWIIGFGFESIGDWQLERFKSNPENKTKVMKSGLWRYTRHPNYFGDATLWWGYFLIALSTPNGYLTFWGPLLMTFMLVRVSGVSLLERSLKKNKPDYQEYIERTSSFLPMPPRK